MTNTQMYDLEKLIEKIVRDNEQKFSTFAKQGFSFEEWLNMELCTSLCVDPSINDDSVFNTPKYENETKRLDISFQKDDEKYAVEIKIAHPGTLEKYKGACSEDFIKLQRAGDYDHRIFVLVVTTTLSADEFINDSIWKTWLDKIFAEKRYSIKSLDHKKNSGSTHIYISEVSSL